MQRQSPSPKRKTASPSRQTRAAEPRYTDTMLEQGEMAQLQLKLKEKEIELDHKLNTLIALNEKLAVFNDLKKDVAENVNCFKDSENARGKL